MLVKATLDSVLSLVEAIVTLATAVVSLVTAWMLNRRERRKSRKRR